MHQATKTVKHKHICNVWYSDMFHSVNAMLCCFEWILRIQTTMYCHPCLYAARLEPFSDVKRKVSDSIHKVKQLPYLIIKYKHSVQDPCISWWASFVLQVFISNTSNIPLTTNQLKILKKYRIVLYIEKELPIKVITQEYNDIYLCAELP